MSDVESPSLIGQLLRTVGGWTTPNGKGLYMFRAMTFSDSCAGLSGVATAFAANVRIGPVGAVAFAIGSSVGSVMASIYG
ncbi:hypothetical protein CLAFUW4_07671 [Fulvia fulva]|uniref:Uncharacterized protein n=1 Tax=Passalora fulva TaxID=5499 RepID=A0A9Q8LDA4_PASFU|nr:uncharacterized protein CLAFUR5_07800 [Fulvia fulva]KAK4629714.1 hypothetical protein CLAFUR4_07676 [Fulvia fulva]KAK4630825.1 hypothetical protein CLAFUR0_07676 [Fulvia fulva]UJO15297.1 hypothetical protein CLAFUR5_07800 [Fulvia fulva]WPV12329.1 hypothetical protein CLAFUW4_07671 [Fulvia fulva]WPV27499.1 hypothetical protein CLAFUW7_07672 [Fulvia fulva]